MLVRSGRLLEQVQQASSGRPALSQLGIVDHVPTRQPPSFDAEAAAPSARLADLIDADARVVDPHGRST